jgi:predicted nucleic acid-binding protein
MTLDAVVAVQTVAEFLNVIRRKQPHLFDDALAQVRRWQDVFELVATTGDHIVSGADFSARFKLQFWDSVIWQVARSSHATLFLTEDLQDQATLEGMKVLNPFNPLNKAELDRLLSSADHKIDW